MEVMIIGAGGMLGGKLARALAREGALGGREIGRLALVDIAAPAPIEGVPAQALACDLAEPGAAARLVARRPDVIFHLAAVVSGEAEADLDKGYRVNLDGTRALLEAIRAAHEGRDGGPQDAGPQDAGPQDGGTQDGGTQDGGDGAAGAAGAPGPYRPRVVFASSIAVFGAPFPARIGDDHAPTPLTSYGAQKAMGELLLADYARRGFLDAIGLRLPTVCIRPGAPNRAASGFFSSILREPLQGREAVLPVDEDVRHWHASPRAAVGFLLRAGAMDLDSVGAWPILTMPGLSATVGEQIEALARAAGEGAARLIRREPDPVVARIVAGWPRDFAPERARRLGFEAEASFDEIIRVFVEDELGGRLA